MPLREKMYDPFWKRKEVRKLNEYLLEDCENQQELCPAWELWKKVCEYAKVCFLLISLFTSHHEITTENILPSVRSMKEIIWVYLNMFLIIMQKVFYTSELATGENKQRNLDKPLPEAAVGMCE